MANMQYCDLLSFVVYRINDSVYMGFPSIKQLAQIPVLACDSTSVWKMVERINSLFQAIEPCESQRRRISVNSLVDVFQIAFGTARYANVVFHACCASLRIPHELGGFVLFLRPQDPDECLHERLRGLQDQEGADTLWHPALPLRPFR